MPFARIDAVKIRVDKTGTVKKIDSVSRDIFLEALSKFLKEVILHVPVYSGMSRGSLRPLARYLTDRGYKVNVPIVPTASSKYVRKKGQNIAAGEQRGEFNVTVKDGQYQLIFQPKVRHYKTNEFTNVSSKLSETAVPRTEKFFSKAELKKLRNLRTINLKKATPWHSFTFGILKMKFFLNSAAVKKRLEAANFVFKPERISAGSARKI